MSTKYKFYDPDGTYFVTFAVVGWVDVFTRNVYRDIVIESFNWCIKNKGLVIHAWVLMTNHVHMIVSRRENNKLEDIMRDMKKFTSVKLLEEIIKSPIESRKEWMLYVFEDAGFMNSQNTKYQFWQHGNHPIELDNNKIIEQKLEYIHNNPVEHGFSNEKECYNWSSAMDYAGLKGLVDIELIR